jgi:hypothetical protein
VSKRKKTNKNLRIEDREVDVIKKNKATAR